MFTYVYIYIYIYIYTCIIHRRNSNVNQICPPLSPSKSEEEAQVRITAAGRCQ